MDEKFVNTFLPIGIHNEAKMELFGNMKNRPIRRFIKEQFKKITIYSCLYFIGDIKGNITIKNMKCYLRPLLEEDFEILESFWNDSLNEDEEFIGGIHTYEEFEKKETLYFGVFYENIMIAYGKIKIRGLKCVELGVGVEKNFRRNGIGTSLIKYFENHLDNKRIKYFVIIDQRNELSIKLFQGIGYHIFKTANDFVYLEHVK